MMTNITIEEKIGQLFIIGFEGSAISRNHPIAEDITKRNLGGVILFDKLIAKKLSINNIISSSQVKELTSDLQDLAGGNLLIAVDQEGGMVTRLKEQHGFPVTPSAELLGQRPDTGETADSSNLIAQKLNSLGINCNLAPVVDLNIYSQNPIIGAYGRSFSYQSDTVFKHAASWIKEHNNQNILTCLKHFPGHGSSRDDSHLGFVDISDTWRERELNPYRKFIETGYQEAIMVGHLFNSRLDANHPAPLSSSTVHTLLRGQLKHTGVIISDDMQMRAITDRYGLPEACCQALLAGVDMIIIGNNLAHDPKILQKVQRKIVTSIKNGILTEDRINEAFEYVQHYKNIRKSANESK